jgi:hypothetical protein
LPEWSWADNDIVDKNNDIVDENNVITDKNNDIVDNINDVVDKRPRINVHQSNIPAGKRFFGRDI